MLPHVAKSSVGVLIYNSTMGTEGKLPVPSIKGKRLPHEAPMIVEVVQEELLVHAHMALQGYHSC